MPFLYDCSCAISSRSISQSTPKAHSSQVYITASADSSLVARSLYHFLHHFFACSDLLALLTQFYNHSIISQLSSAFVSTINAMQPTMYVFGKNYSSVSSCSLARLLPFVCSACSSRRLTLITVPLVCRLGNSLSLFGIYVTERLM
jgi:hypothetical protein